MNGIMGYAEQITAVASMRAAAARAQQVQQLQQHQVGRTDKEQQQVQQSDEHQRQAEQPEQQQQGQFNSEMQSLSRTILSCSEHIMSILDNVLDISKLEAGKLTLRKLPVSVELICREIQQSMRSMAAPGVSFVCACGTPGLALMADGVRWKQVLINLVSNSLKFTKKAGGRVRLDIHKDEVSGAVICSVSDTGKNIPPNLRDRLFSKYEQAQDAQNGTGLGLVISQHLVELMGATIKVQSPWHADNSPGSRFFFELTDYEQIPDPLLAKARSMSGGWFSGDEDEEGPAFDAAVGEGQGEGKDGLASMGGGRGGRTSPARQPRKRSHPGRVRPRAMSDARGAETGAAAGGDTVTAPPAVRRTNLDMLGRSNDTAASAAEPGSPTADSLAATIRGLSVLVVDDGEMNRKVGRHSTRSHSLTRSLAHSLRRSCSLAHSLTRSGARAHSLL
jgi:hypothetical protein